MTTSVRLQTFIIDQYSIELYVPQPDHIKELYQQQIKFNSATAFPYWAKVWPAAIALTKFIIQHPDYIQNKKVLELAAGLGLPSIVSAKFAQSVICSDYLPEAVTVAQSSMLHNQLKNASCVLINWEHIPTETEADVLLLSDINYDPNAFAILHQVLMQFLNHGATILLSTPQRLASKPFIEGILPYCIRQQEIIVQEQGMEVITMVMVLKKVLNNGAPF